MAQAEEDQEAEVGKEVGQVEKAALNQVEELGKEKVGRRQIKRDRASASSSRLLDTVIMGWG